MFPIEHVDVPVGSLDQVPGYGDLVPDMGSSRNFVINDDPYDKAGGLTSMAFVLEDGKLVTDEDGKAVSVFVNFLVKDAQ